MPAKDHGKEDKKKKEKERKKKEKEVKEEKEREEKEKKKQQKEKEKKISEMKRRFSVSLKPFSCIVFIHLMSCTCPGPNRFFYSC